MHVAVAHHPHVSGTCSTNSKLCRAPPPKASSSALPDWMISSLAGWPLKNAYSDGCSARTVVAAHRETRVSRRWVLLEPP